MTEALPRDATEGRAVSLGGLESRQPTWLTALRAYLTLSLGLHVLWETLQLPLYAIWTTGTIGTKTFTIVHCALGDLIIAALALVAALVVIGSNAWPLQRFREVFVMTVIFGIGYTFYSEWLNTTVRQNWAYSRLMPVLPLIGTGLSPILQWLVVPSVALTLTRRRYLM
jgi:hypothetical protein